MIALDTTIGSKS